MHVNWNWKFQVQMKLNFEWFCHWKFIKLQKRKLEKIISRVIINSHLIDDIGYISIK
jgi:hypothetical protein